jgi:hypothetical protein
MKRKLIALIVVICFFQFTVFASGFNYKFSTFGGGLPSSIKKMAYEENSEVSDIVLSSEDTDSEAENFSDEEAEEIASEDIEEDVAGPQMSISGGKSTETQKTWEEIDNVTNESKKKNKAAIIGTVVVGTVVVAGLIFGGIMLANNSTVCADSCDSGCSEDCTTNLCNSCVDSSSEQCTQALCDDMLSSSCDSAIGSSTTSCSNGFASLPAMLNFFPVYVP